MVTFAKRSKQTPIQKSITGLLVSADHQICSEVLKSPNWLARPLAEKLYKAAHTYNKHDVHPFLDSIIAMDGPEHKRVKKLLHVVFNPKLVESWKVSSTKLAKELVAAIETNQEFDFVAVIANPLPLAIISEIIGVPREHRSECNSWGKTLGGIGLDLPKNNLELRELEAAAKGLTELIAGLLEQRRLKPEDDLISILAHSDSDGEKLSDKEIIATAAFTLAAGFETTVNLLSVGMNELLDNKEQLEQLVKNPELPNNFIEESLRLSSPIQFCVRTAAETVVLSDGTRVRKGQTIMLNLAGANRDPKVFAQPDAFEIERETAKKHVAFGFGAHHCIGALLARVEAEALFTELLRRFPDSTKWQAAGQPEPRTSKLVGGLEKLPMKFL
jgi:cytochrome P450